MLRVRRPRLLCVVRGYLLNACARNSTKAATRRLGVPLA